MSDFTADIRYRTSNEGGRLSPVQDGYRGQLFYDGHDWDAVHYFPNQKPLLGNDVSTEISVTNIPAHTGKLYYGMTFQVREGRRIVADGRIISVNNKTLEKK